MACVNALPILYFNLGGEMMYILDQRLKAQKIPSEKAERVLKDIIGTMVHSRFMEELFKPQGLYSRRAVRSLFEKLAHASIMRLNETSMEKLYDLMTMVFKYQLYMCPDPTDLLMITLNHLDAIRGFVANAPTVLTEVENAFALIIQHYATATSAEFQLLRYSLLSFFQDLNVRVSVFLKIGAQRPDGRFVLPTSGPVPVGGEIPGTIREFGPDGEVVHESRFHAGGDYTLPSANASLELEGDRNIDLGTNIYAASKDDIQTENAPEAEPADQPPPERDSSPLADLDQDSRAREELALLARLIGQAEMPDAPSKAEFTLSLFESHEDEQILEGKVEGDGQRIVNIQAEKVTSPSELQQIIDDFAITDTSAEASCNSNLLDLMDMASS